MEKNTEDNIGLRIREARKEAGMTQEELATAAGVTRSAVALWETGDTKNLKAENVFKVARKLNRSAEWLVTGEGSPLPNGALREIITALPDDSGQQALDFILYRVEKAEGMIASDKLSRYAAMIEGFKQDLEKRRKLE